MSKLDDIYTVTDAAERWHISVSNLRNALGKFGRFDKEIEEGLVRKSGSTWLITKEAMESVFGENQKGVVKMEFTKLVDELVGKEISLIHMDNTLHPESIGKSIFEYGQEYWKGWQGSFAYKIAEDLSINILFDIVEDHGISQDTVVKIREWDEV